MRRPTTTIMHSPTLRILALLSLPALLITCSPEPEPTAPAEPAASTMLQAEEQASSSGVGEWGAFAADNGATKYTNLDQIDASNVTDLEIVWRRPALDAYYSAMNPRQRYTSTWTSAPIVKNGIAYVPNGIGLVEAFNPGTGATIWVQEPHGGVEGLPGASTRGVAYWS